MHTLSSIYFWLTDIQAPRNCSYAQDAVDSEQSHRPDGDPAWRHFRDSAGPQMLRASLLVDLFPCVQPVRQMKSIILKFEDKSLLMLYVSGGGAITPAEDWLE